MTSEFKRAVENVIRTLYPVGCLQSSLENGQIIVPPAIMNEAELTVRKTIESLMRPTEKTMDNFRAASFEEWDNALNHILNGSD